MTAFLRPSLVGSHAAVWTVLVVVCSTPVLHASEPALLLGRSLAEWSRLCAAPSSTTRLAALRTIPQLGPSAVPVLTNALGDPDAAVRWTAANGLATMPQVTPPARAALANALGDAEPAVRVVAAAALARHGEHRRAIPTLVEALGHRREAVRLAAIGAFELMEENAQPALGPIHQALEDSNKYVVRIATRIVNRLEGKRLVPP